MRILSSATPSNESRPNASNAVGENLARLHEVASNRMYGFIAGNKLSKAVVHVIFDPQCPHCAVLWVQSKLLWNDIKFVWLPVPLLRPESARNGAVILASTNPIETMNDHEDRLLNEKAPMAIDAQLLGAGLPQIEHNKLIAKEYRVDAVPLVMTRRINGEIVSTAGGIGAGEVIQLITG